MALRYRMQSRHEDAKIQFPAAVPAVYREGATLEFIKGADPRKFAANIMANPIVYVDGATGAGKSVILPSAISLESRSRVFHVTPGNLLALELYNYVKKRADDQPSECPVMEYIDEKMDVPRSGLVFCSAVTLVSWLIKCKTTFDRSQAGDFRPLAGSTVFLDESHESDAYTHIVRSLSRHLGATNLVMTSATHGETGHHSHAGRGQLNLVPYESEIVPESWDVLRRDLPWCVNSLPGNLLVFTDSSKQARCIANKYAAAGMVAFRLTANMETGKFREAMLACKDLQGPKVVLVADYSFRSGFTFDVSTIVDTGRAAYVCCDGGDVAKRTRPIFEFERVQAAGRGGRMPGQVTDYYYPDIDYEHAIVELEGVEVEAVALLYRVLGFKPPLDFQSCHMAEHNPSDLLGYALGGDYPLVLCSGPRFEGSSASAKPVAKQPAVQVPIAELPVVPEDPVSVKLDPQGELEGVNVSGADAALKFLRETIDSKQPPQTLDTLERLYGMFLFVEGMTLDNRNSQFHDIDHVGKVRRRLGCRWFRHSATDDDYMQAVGLLCNEYNNVAIQVAGAIAAAKQLHKRVMAAGGTFSVRSARQILADIAADRTVMQVYFKDLLEMCGRQLEVRALPVPTSLTDQITEALVVRHSPSVRNRGADRGMSQTKYIAHVSSTQEVARPKTRHLIADVADTRTREGYRLCVDVSTGERVVLPGKTHNKNRAKSKHPADKSKPKSRLIELPRHTRSRSFAESVASAFSGSSSLDL